MKIYCVDDEPAIRKLVEKIVKDAGYDFVSAEDGMEAVLNFDEVNPDLLILDVMMPRMNGFQVCELLRTRGVNIPIIFLSAKGEISDKEEGYDLGADDYIAKPFSPRELLLHINARLRQEQRRSSHAANLVVQGEFEIDMLSHQVKKNGVSLNLTPNEFSVMSLLACNAGEVFTREQLIEHVWGVNYYGEPSAVAVLVRRLREKVEDNASEPKYIQTVWHLGYKFVIEINE